MRRFPKRTLAILLAAYSMTSVSFADSLLGIIGDSDSGSLITLGGGEAGNSGLVNLGLGGGDGNVLDANIGRSGSGSLVDANVSLGGSAGLVDVTAGVGNIVDANVNVGGPNGLIGVDIGIGGPGTGGPGGPGGPGTPGGPGGPGNPGGPGGPGGVPPGFVVVRGGGGSGSGVMIGSNRASCANTNTAQLLELFNSTKMQGWNRADGIQLIPIKVCAEIRQQLANYLVANGNYHSMVQAVASDPLIRAALSRTRYQPGHVLGVQKSGSQLTVFVF